MPSPVELLDELRHRLRGLEIPCALCSRTSGPLLIGGEREVEPHQGIEGFEGNCFSVEVDEEDSSPGVPVIFASFGTDLRVTTHNPRRMAFAIFALVKGLPTPVPAS